ncbi:MAG: hypothetical protein MHMPM18_001142 [Marteilia pararefringens]
MVSPNSSGNECTGIRCMPLLHTLIVVVSFLAGLLTVACLYCCKNYRDVINVFRGYGNVRDNSDISDNEE